ncbi:MAG: hypothetical protein PHW10_00195 [Candidatus Peribacteraceae bacterium]|nr:hypothetical protein [Candidatus Peribacteraceae bacterium]
MNPQLTSILDELYKIDPDLRSHEAELIPLLERLLRHRPDVSPDPAFVSELRTMLLREAAAMKERPARSVASFFSFLASSRALYAVTGAVLGILVTVPVVTSFLGSDGVNIPAPTGERNSSQKALAPFFAPSVREEGDHAFGDLSAIPQGAEATLGRGGGGGDAATMDAPAGMIYPPEGITQLEYVFEGELPALPDGTVDVLRREKKVTGPSLSSVINTFDIGMVNLTSFQGSAVNLLTFMQDRPFGYLVSVMFNDGEIGISPLWEQWPHPEQNCKDEACFQRYRVTLDDVPADDVLIGIAQDFVTAHGIDSAKYGTPEVDKTWRDEYARAEDKTQFYIPESQRVIFPLLIDGKPVYEMGGSKMGISVGVNVREKKVADVWGIKSQTYASSAYDAVADAAAVKEYLENFERYPTEPLAARGLEVKKLTVKLGAPESGYAMFYKQDGNRTDELIIPSLIFPVEEMPEGVPYYSRRTVAVPLAKDMLERGQGGPVFRQ